MKFLVVDDSPTIRCIVCSALRELGYSDLVEAGDGREALAFLEADRPDFVITDWNMPNMNGLDLTRSIRAHAQHGNLPILMLTTRGMKEEVLAAMQARVNNYVIKPCTARALRKKIDSILKESVPS